MKSEISEFINVLAKNPKLRFQFNNAKSAKESYNIAKPYIKNLSLSNLVKEMQYLTEFSSTEKVPQLYHDAI
jgi:hypothetical protein